ncbi:MAG: hypothetical protein WC291_00755, partial [Thermodesulfovibrionales bacterium]
MFIKRLVAVFFMLSCILPNALIYAEDAASPAASTSSAQSPVVSSSPSPGQAQAPVSSPSPLSMSPSSITPGMMQNLTPAQQSAVQGVIQQKGLTPEAVEALKTSPEFKNLTPEDILKG